MKILSGHNSQESAYIVEDYPYGFTLRCKIRFWIESNKNGDRFISQTLNPKTGHWNNPKKSVYRSIESLYLDENNHVKSFGVSAGWDSEEKLNDFLVKLGADYPLNDYQKKQIARIKAISRTQAFIKVEVKAEGNLTAEQRADKEAEQKEVKKTIGLIYASELSKAVKE